MAAVGSGEEGGSHSNLFGFLAAPPVCVSVWAWLRSALLHTCNQSAHHLFQSAHLPLISSSALQCLTHPEPDHCVSYRDGGTMKTVVALLLLCLCDPGQSDCQAECMSCSNILPKQLSFNTMVCLTECEANVSPAFSWDFCRKVLSSPISSLTGMMRKRSQEEVEALFPEEDEQLDGGLLLPFALQRYDHMTRALGVDERDLGGRGSQLKTAYNSQNDLSLEDEYEEEAGQEEGAADMAMRGQGDAGPSVSKRFGGFVKGRHGYRKLMSPGRSYQKRYGGFIGIRKSARKWNNQKRFSEFLKQYLGMSTKATEFNSVSEDLTQQNEV
ncbi:proenkephalin-A isoform X2 [Sebastes umbrosus]|uniref:proenkephalin-A isoform X2 n=1 Tax=Sebastes umbrosus TaxID=72105 RepID=UPI00189EA460|nr:proenkephalin-A isoform X2 [Sebastes umbrosus]